jgi:hypothetical protein
MADDPERKTQDETDEVGRAQDEDVDDEDLEDEDDDEVAEDEDVEEGE